MPVGGDQKCVAIWSRSRDEFRADDGPRTRSIVYYDSLSQGFAHFLTDNARTNIDAATGGKWDNEANRFRGICFSVNSSPRHRECGDGSCNDMFDSPHGTHPFTLEPQC